MSSNNQSIGNSVGASAVVGSKPDGQQDIQTLNGIDPNNSTYNNLLVANGEFTGGWTNVELYSVIVATIFTDKNSAINGLVIQYSHNAVDVILETDKYTIERSEESGSIFSFQTGPKYYRLYYKNGSADQNKFVIETKLLTTRSKPSSHRIGDIISVQNDAELTKTVGAGIGPENNIINGRSSGFVPDQSSTLPLLAGGTFNNNGPWTDISGFTSILITVNSDKPSANLGIVAEFSNDKVNIFAKEEISYKNPGDAEKISFDSRRAKFIRVRYVNADEDQTIFTISTFLGTGPTSPTVISIQSEIVKNLSSILTKSVIAGEDGDGIFRNAEVTQSRELLVATGARLSSILGRVSVLKNIENASITSGGIEIHPVTNGKSFYMTSVTISLLNSGGTVGRFVLRDGILEAGNKIPLLVNEQAVGTPSQLLMTSPNLENEPIKFDSSVMAYGLAGNIIGSILIIGYEE